MVNFHSKTISVTGWFLVVIAIGKRKRLQEGNVCCRSHVDMLSQAVKSLSTQLRDDSIIVCKASILLDLWLFL